MNAIAAFQMPSYGDLTKMWIKQTMPVSEKYRSYFGRATDMNRLEASLRQADDGFMVQLCDLESEILSLDPHLSGLLAKRFGTISSTDWELVPPKGPDVDVKAAKEIAEKVGQDLAAIPFFEEALYDMLWSLYDGRAAMETNWQMTTGRYRWRPVELRWVHPRRISFGPRRELRIIDPWRTSGNFGTDGFAMDEIPGKFIWWAPRLFREYPEREGLAPRTLYWSFFKRFSWRYRMTLTEMFGLPWRIITQDPEMAQGSSVEDAFEMAEKLGEETTAVLDPGMKLDVLPPHPESGSMFQMTSEEVDLQMSKLVLGGTGTTDATGNRAESIVHKGEQDIIAVRDAGGLSERITERLVKPDVRFNFGADNLVNAPRFRIKADPPRDMAAEQERAGKAIQIGVPVSVKQYRTISGMAEPEEGEPFIVSQSTGEIDPMTGQQKPAAPIIVDPTLEEPEPTLEEQGVAGAEQRAEDDLKTAQAKRDVRDAFSIGITSVQNHGHALCIPQSDLLEVDGPKQYDIKGLATHGHALLLTGPQLLTLSQGSTVTAEAAPGGETPHTHQVALARAVLAERPKGSPFGGFQDFEDCLSTVKASDPSLSDEAARNVAHALQDREEEATRACMGHLLELARSEE